MNGVLNSPYFEFSLFKKVFNFFFRYYYALKIQDKIFKKYLLKRSDFPFCWLPCV